MGRRRRRRGGTGGQGAPDLRSILDGTVSLDPRELIALIHRINPTDRDLPKQEEAARYAQKSALQSLLIRSHGEHLDLVVDPRSDDVVSLRHRVSGFDAAHAVVAELDDDARSWIRHHLDAGSASAQARSTDPEPKRAPRADHASAPGPSGDHLTRGRTALKEYDFEAAEQHLRAAVEETPGSIKAATSLLELLVDHLAADVEAHALRASLELPARETPEVRGLLAVAAARADRPDARELLRGASRARATDALAVLAENALRSDRPELAAELAGQARLLVGEDIARLPHLASLDARVAAAAAARVARAEEDLAEQVSGLEVDDALAAVEQFLLAYPDSDRGTRLHRELRRAQLAPRVAELRSAARAALDQQGPGEAARLAREAIGLDDRDEPTRAVLLQAEAEVERQRVRVEEERVVRELAGGDPVAALVSWRGLPGRSRTRLVTELESRPLACFARLVEHHRREPVESLAQAALALVEAEDELEADRPERALAAVDPHIRLLRHHTQVDDLCHQARRRREEKAREHALSLLDQAERQALEGDRVGAERLLDEIDDRWLEPGDFAAVEAILAVLSDEEACRFMLEDAENAWERTGVRLEAHPAEMPDLLDLLVALESIDRLLTTDGHDLDTWAIRQAQLREALRRHANTLVVHDPPPETIGTEDVAVQPGGEAGGVIAGLDTGELLHAEVVASHLFLRVLEPGSCRVKTAVSLRLPAGVRPPVQLGPYEDRLWVCASGYFFTLDLTTWEWRDHAVLPGLVRAEEVERVLLVAGRFLWVRGAARTGAVEGPVHVIDTHGGERMKVLPHAWSVSPIVGRGIELVLHHSRVGGAVVYEPSGKPALQYRTGAAGGAFAGLVHSDGERLVLFTGPAEQGPGQAGDAPPENDDRLAIVVVDPGGSAWPARPVAHTEALFALSGATPDTDEPLVFLQARDDGTREVRALVPAPDSDFAELWSREHQGDAILARRGRPERVEVVLGTSAGLVSYPTGSLPPDDLPSDRTGVKLPVLECPLGSPCSPRPEGEPVPKDLTKYRRLSGKALGREVDRAWGVFEGQPRSLIAFAHLLLAAGRREAATGLLSRILGSYPDRPTARGLLAGIAADQGNWGAVLQHLPAIVSCEAEKGFATHFAHLRGLALHHQGRTDEAYETWRAGQERGLGVCTLAPLAGLVAPLGLPDDELDLLGADAAAVVMLRRAVAEATAALDTGDVPRALGAIDVPVVWRARELHSSADLASTWFTAVEGSVPDASTAFRVRMAAARFLDARVGGRAVAWTEGTWTPGALEGLAKQALGWLEVR